MEDPYRRTVLGRSITLAYVPVLYTLLGIYFEARNSKGNFFQIHQQSGVERDIVAFGTSIFCGDVGEDLYSNSAR